MHAAARQSNTPPKIPWSNGKDPEETPATVSHLPKRSKPYSPSSVLLLMLFLSLSVHILSYVRLGIFSDSRTRKTVSTPITFHLPELKESSKPIIETKQTKTAPPKVATALGQTDHSTDHETKVTKQEIRKKAADAGTEGNPNATGTTMTKSESRPLPHPTSPTSNLNISSTVGKVTVAPMNAKPRNKYEEMLPTTMDLQGQYNAGFQEYVKDDIAEGTRVDMNTTEYRYIGYFSSMRKAIELVWVYPELAIRQQLQGETHVEFVIAKNGKVSRIRVVRSSGYGVLDRAIVEAIQMASPFAPLPPGFKMDRMVVTGAFTYRLL